MKEANRPFVFLSQHLNLLFSFYLRSRGQLDLSVWLLQVWQNQVHSPDRQVWQCLRLHGWHRWDWMWYVKLQFYVLVPFSLLALFLFLPCWNLAFDLFSGSFVGHHSSNGSSLCYSLVNLWQYMWLLLLGWYDRKLIYKQVLRKKGGTLISQLFFCCSWAKVKWTF